MEPVYIGKIKKDAQFDIVWSSNGSVRPVHIQSHAQKLRGTPSSTTFTVAGGLGQPGITQTEEAPEND